MRNPSNIVEVPLGTCSEANPERLATVLPPDLRVIRGGFQRVQEEGWAEAEMEGTDAGGPEEQVGKPAVCFSTKAAHGESGVGPGI